MSVRKSIPLVTVALTTFNHERFIRRALQSVVDQGLEDIEIFVLDDASTDDTAGQISPFLDDPRITYIRHETNLGSKGNNTLALETGGGRYLVWMHGDDFLLPGHLHDAVRTLESNPTCALAYSPCYWVDDDDRIICLKRHPGHLPASYCGRRNEFAELLVHDNYVTPSAAVMRRRAVEAVGNFDQDPDLRAGDWDLFVRMAARHGDFAFVDRASTAYRIHGGQFSHGFYANEAPLYAHVRILEKSLDSEFAPRLAGWERRIGAHLQARLNAYPEEVRARYAERVQSLSVRLNESARSSRRRSLGKDPKVSIVVPTMNRPELLQDALQSLVGQTYENWEAVVVNDAGADVSAIASTVDPKQRIRYASHTVNCGLPAARNTGIRLTDGSIVCYLDDDDLFRPEHLQTVVDALSHEEGEFVYTNAEYVHEDLREGERLEKGRDRRYADISYSIEQLHVSNFIPVNSWAHRRALLGETGLFDEGLSALEDWELLLRISRNAQVHHIDEVTVEVRERASGERMSDRLRQQFPRLFREIYQRYDDLGSNAVAEGRRQMLEKLDAESEAKAERTEPRVAGQGEQYSIWCAKHALDAPKAQFMAERMLRSWKRNPSIHLITVVQAGSEAALGATLESLGMQLYKGWGLTVLSDAPMPDSLFGSGTNLEWIQTTSAEFVETLNSSVRETGADWIAVLDAGDLLAPHALFSFADYANLYDGWKLIYCDSDVALPDGSGSKPRFLPDYNAELLRSTPYFGNFCLIAREAVQAVGGIRAVPGCEMYDLAFRTIEKYGEAAIGHVPDVLLHQREENRGMYDEPPVREMACQVVTEHLERIGQPARVSAGLLPGSHYIQYLHDAQPLVSIIIPTKDRLDLLKPCIQSLLEKTSYSNFEVLVVDNNSSDPATLDYLDSLDVGSAKARVLRYPHEYNFSAINNFAVREAKGEYLVLLNNDTQIVQEQWLDRMMAHGQRREVGVVGARLVFADQRIQHAGVILGLGTADHPFIGLPMNEPGYLGRAQLAQNYSAVTAACLLVRRSVYEEVGGLDEEVFKVLYNDVDFCLEVGEHGYKIVYTPFATVVHHGSSSLKSKEHRQTVPKEPVEAYAMFDKWLPKLAGDPAYNRNLSLRDRDMRVDASLVAGWNTDFHDRPRVLAYPLDAWGSGHYRVLAPVNALADATLIQSTVVESQDQGGVIGIADWARLAPDSVVVQGFLHDVQLKTLELYRRFSAKTRLIYELDDLKTDMPPSNPKSRTMPQDVGARLQEALSYCDRMIVSTEPLRDAYSHLIEDIIVVPNRLERSRWDGLTSLRRAGGKPRVGWAGAQQHHGDLALLREVVEATAEEVEWIFFGMCPHELRRFVTEFHEGVVFDRYPAKLASLNLDLAVAPLELNRFNEAKSNLRLLEYGIMGWPVVCTDIEPYRAHTAPVSRVVNTTAAWVEAIRQHVYDLDASERAGDRLRAWVQRHWMLEDHLDEWLTALTEDAQSPARVLAGVAR